MYLLHDKNYVLANCSKQTTKNWRRKTSTSYHIKQANI